MHAARVSFAVQVHFLQWGRQECADSSPGISSGSPCGLSCVCLAEPLSPGRSADLGPQRAGRIASRGKYFKDWDRSRV